MLRNSKPTNLFFGMILLFLCIYGSASYLVYYNSRLTRAVKRTGVSNEFLKKAVANHVFFDPVFFREAALKVQSVRHDPDVVRFAFQLSSVKAPAQHGSLLQYGIYTSSTNCCRHQAPTLFREATKRKPQDPSVHLLAGSALLESGNKKDAFEHFRMSLTIDESRARDVYVFMASRHASVEEMISVTPKRSGSFIALATVLGSGSGRNSKDLDTVWFEVDKLPMDPKQRLAVARAALRVGNTERARIHARHAVQASSTRADAWKLLSEVALKDKNWNEFQEYTESLEQHYGRNGDPEKAASFALESARLFSRAGHAKTKERIHRVLDRYPNYAPAYIAMASISREVPKEALFFLRGAVRLQPKNFEYNSKLAKQYLEMSMVSEAEDIYGRFSEDKEFTVSAFLGLASCKRKTGNFYEAISVLQKGLRRSNRSPELLQELGRTYETVGEYRKAAEAYKNLADLTPAKPSGYVLAAQMYEKAGAFKAAEKEYSRVLVLEPSNPDAMKALSILQSQ
jgi:tetratricopeptide (TPR) repeat protein